MVLRARNALNCTGICSSSSEHRRVVEWTEAGVFHEFWTKALDGYDEFGGLDWSWLSIDGAMTKAPLGVEKTGPRPTQADPQGLCLDKGYDDDEVRALAREFRITAHIRSRGEEG